jgi:hypothetical protein
MPPFFALVRIERVLNLVPPSQSFVHFDQPDHSDSTQLTGHLICLHFFCLAIGGQIMPYSLGATTTSLTMVSKPPHA